MLMTSGGSLERGEERLQTENQKKPKHNGSESFEEIIFGNNLERPVLSAS